MLKNGQPRYDLGIILEPTLGEVSFSSRIGKIDLILFSLRIHYYKVMRGTVRLANSGRTEFGFDRNKSLISTANSDLLPVK